MKKEKREALSCNRISLFYYTNIIQNKEILEEKYLKRIQDLDLKYNYIYIGKCMIKLLYIDFKWSEIA